MAPAKNAIPAAQRRDVAESEFAVPTDAPAPRILVRVANQSDLEAIRTIYNQGIEDRSATLETSTIERDDIATWWAEHDDRYAVMVAETAGEICGWGALNKFSHRCAHRSIADLSIYVERAHRGMGVGRTLLEHVVRRARGTFRKIVLHALNDNAAGKRLYSACGFREIGVFREHGEIDGRPVDVVAMEKLLCAEP
jgi:L-amino acid N-acyltransferase YncA